MLHGYIVKRKVSALGLDVVKSAPTPLSARSFLER